MRKRKKTDSDVTLFHWVSMVAVAAFVIIPFYTTLMGGFKSIGELRTSPFALPRTWDFSNFASVIEGGGLLHSMGQSLFVALMTVVLTLLLSSLTAFALAFIRFHGRRLVLATLVIGLLFPAATAILPLFIKLRDLGLLNSVWGIILPQVAFSLAFSVVMFRSFFLQLPREIMDAARMDNCGYLRAYWFITLPLSLPIIATTGVFAFISSWNNFLMPLIVLSNEEDYTWPLGIMQFQGQYSSDWPKILAYLTLTILPAIGFFLLAQRYIISGLTGGAVKG